MPKTKVVDLEILSKFGIQKFFVWGQKEVENWVYKLEFLNFSLNTKLPSLHLALLCFLSRRGDAVLMPYAGAAIGRPRAEL